MTNVCLQSHKKGTTILLGCVCRISVSSPVCLVMTENYGLVACAWTTALPWRIMDILPALLWAFKHSKTCSHRVQGTELTTQGTGDLQKSRLCPIASFVLGT